MKFSTENMQGNEKKRLVTCSDDNTITGQHKEQQEMLRNQSV